MDSCWTEIGKKKSNLGEEDAGGVGRADAVDQRVRDLVDPRVHDRLQADGPARFGIFGQDAEGLAVQLTPQLVGVDALVLTAPKKETI